VKAHDELVAAGLGEEAFDEEVGFLKAARGTLRMESKMG
jgi:hypothetical protein